MALRSFPIDFIRQTLEQTLLEQRIINPSKYVGGKDQVSIKSFYEHIQTQEEVDRFVETIRDLDNQQNRTGLIGNGIISLAENPTITNINRGIIVPMTWNCMIRCTLKDRDLMVESINNMIAILKGRKVDIAEFSNGELFKVGTIGYHPYTTGMSIKCGDFLGEIDATLNFNSEIERLISAYHSQGINVVDFAGANPLRYFYVVDDEGEYMHTAYYSHQNNRYEEVSGVANVIYAPSNKTFTKYKLSLSFDSIRIDEPKMLNGDEYCYISFSGSATLVNLTTKLGNDLQCLSFKRVKIVAESDITLSDTEHYLEPLEMPNENSINTKINHITSNGFIPNTHTDTTTPTLQYSFICDDSISFLKELFEYARYGISGIDINHISPNMIFEIVEWWSSWGDISKYTFSGKIVESVSIENTESDVLTLQLSVQIQGANN